MLPEWDCSKPLPKQAQTPALATNKRTAAPDRTGPIWDSVTVVREHDTTPQVKCNNCVHAFCSVATRIEAHIIDKCPCETDVFLAMKEKLLKKREEKDDAKKQKMTVDEMNTV